MTQFRQSIRYSAIFWVVAASSNAGSLRTLWEINLKDSIKELEHAKVREPTVFALRFSPDGQNIAVVVEQYALDGSEGWSNHLLVVPVRRSNEAIHQFEISAGTTELDYPNRWVGFEWTAAGDAIVVGGEVVRLTDRKPCGFTLGAPIRNPFAEEGRIAKFLLLDRACSAGADWKFASDWILKDVSIDRSLICISQQVRWGPQDVVAAEAARISGRSNEVLIVEPITGRVLQHWPPSVMPDGEVKFGDSGRVICEAATVESPGKVPVRCWDVNTGKQIAEAVSIRGGAPMVVAARATRAIASDYRRSGVPLTDSFREVLKRRTVWDFKTGLELASWKPELQPYDVGLEPVTKWWSAFAISADGQYVAEGGNGILRLYQIKP